MNAEHIGKLKRVALREVWKHEAYDFTQWLQENIDVLNDALDLNLVNVDREQATGLFSIDLVGQNKGVGNIFSCALSASQTSLPLAPLTATPVTHCSTNICLSRCLDRLTDRVEKVLISSEGFHPVRHRMSHSELSSCPHRAADGDAVRCVLSSES